MEIAAMFIQPLLLAFALSPIQESAPPSITWDAVTAEHLLTRAGFGASRTRIERAVQVGLEATVDELFAGKDERDPYLIVRYEPHPDELAALPREKRQDVVVAARIRAAGMVRDYRLSWFDRLLENEDPLRERMLLFWHGFFTTSAAVVTEGDSVLRQIELLRKGALGNYGELLHAIVRDPAMLEYLDNDENKRKWANENLARELMELFSLGEGNYTEEDVKEAARALTGYRPGPTGKFEFRRSDHDSKMKTILGVTDRFDGDRLVDLLLAQDACPLWLAGRLLEYFEGVAPSAERLTSYAAQLRESDFEIEPFLRRLFTDPAFYREEIVGARVTSPIDLMVGTCLRVGMDPPPIFLHLSSWMLGQLLMEPPNVKGWEEGETWISTSSFMLRGNLQGLMLGVFTFDDTESNVVAALERSFATELRTLREFGESNYRPRINLASRIAAHNATSDRRIVEFLVEELLATTVEESALVLLVEFLGKERQALGFDEGTLQTSGVRGEALLRRLAHLILSLPEAQLS